MSSSQPDAWQPGIGSKAVGAHQAKLGIMNVVQPVWPSAMAILAVQQLRPEVPACNTNSTGLH